MFEGSGNGLEFRFDPLFSVRDEVESGVSGADVMAGCLFISCGEMESALSELAELLHEFARIGLGKLPGFSGEGTQTLAQ